MKTIYATFVFLTFNYYCYSQKMECGTTFSNPNRSTSDLIINPSNSGASSGYSVNVFFHIVRKSDGTGGFNENELNEVLDNMNVAYRTHNICIKNIGFDYINDDRYYVIEADSEPQEFSQLIQIQNKSNAVNAYIVNEAPYYGRAAEIPSLSFVVIKDNAKTETSAHELGHCLSLYHTHRGLGHRETGRDTCAEVTPSKEPNCKDCGDHVCDTPADDGEYGNVLGNRPDLTNIMSYYRPRNHFTAGQGQRMLGALASVPMLLTKTNVFV